MINCNNCNSTAVVYSGALMHGRNKMAKLKCEDCGTNTFIGWDTYQEMYSNILEQGSTYTVIEPILERKRLVVTCAVIGHQINSLFLSSLESYCEFNDADLVVIPIKYKNASAIMNVDNLAVQYYATNNFTFGDQFRIMGGLKLNASMEHPLSGLDPLSKGKSLIFGHPQVALKTVPSDGKYPSLISTTGCVSEKFYTDTKQGLKAEFNHSHSAVVLEIDQDGDTHMRHLNFDGEGFWDIRHYYSGWVVTESDDGLLIPALITGDEHVLFQDKTVVGATYTNPNSILNVMKPEVIVRHDVLDSYSISHHHKHNIFTKYAKWKDGVCTIEDELIKTINFITETTPEYSISVIVSSNHNDHLTRWLNECDPEEEPWNAKIYHWFMYQMLKETKMGESGSEYPDPFKLYAEEFLGQIVLNYSMEFIGRNEAYLIGDVSIQHHGDRGTNGARGSRSQFSKLPTKNVIGHSHSPGIDKGTYQTGTSSKLRLEYNSGPSGWHHCHCLIYPNYKRQLIFITNGKWRA